MTSRPKGICVSPRLSDPACGTLMCTWCCTSPQVGVGKFGPGCVRLAEAPITGLWRRERDGEEVIVHKRLNHTRTCATVNSDMNIDHIETCTPMVTDTHLDVGRPTLDTQHSTLQSWSGRESES